MQEWPAEDRMADTRRGVGGKQRLAQDENENIDGIVEAMRWIKNFHSFPETIYIYVFALLRIGMYVYHVSFT